MHQWSKTKPEKDLRPRICNSSENVAYPGIDIHIQTFTIGLIFWLFLARKRFLPVPIGRSFQTITV